MNRNTKQPDLIERTLKKFQRSQEKKKSLIHYLAKHKPDLVKSIRKRQRIRDCGNVLLFEEYANGKQKLRSGSFCKYDKFCLACSTRRAIKMIQRFERYIKANELMEKNWYYIVLTIRHKPNDPLSLLLNKLMNGKAQLARNYRNGKRTKDRQGSFFSQFDGIVSSIEITKNRNGRHPHLNLLVCTDNEVQIEKNRYRSVGGKGSNTNEKLRNEWLGITGDSYIHNIRKIDVSKNHFNLDGIGEVFKYAIKFSSLAVDQLAEIVELQQQKKYRFYDTYGIFRRMGKLENNYSKENAVSKQTFQFVDNAYHDIEYHA